MEKKVGGRGGQLGITPKILFSAYGRESLGRREKDFKGRDVGKKQRKCHITSFNEIKD